MTQPLDWICAPDRPHLARPFAVDGYAVACDGRMLLAVRGVAADPPPSDDIGAMHPIGAWLAEPPSGREVALVDLRAFAGEAVWSSPCDECDGTGSLLVLLTCVNCGGGGTVECVCSCGDVHEIDCIDCRGIGTAHGSLGNAVTCKDCAGTGATPRLVGSPVAVAVEDAMVDRRLLARLLACVPDGERVTVRVAVRDGFPRLALWGDGWHARLMGLRVDGEPVATFGQGSC